MTEQLEGQMSIYDLAGWSGKTCSEPSRATPGRTSELSSKKPQRSQTRPPLFLDLRKTRSGHQADASWVTAGALPGEYTMRSFGEYPSEERGSRLSQILQEEVHLKYYLSGRACQGILNRAKRRKKEIPEEMKRILLTQVNNTAAGNQIR